MPQRVREIFKHEAVALGRSYASKEEALRDIARLAVQNPAVGEVTEEEIFNALLERENLISTDFGHGIAIPHCKLDGLSDFVVGTITVPQGVDFDAEDKEPVRLIIFIIAPTKDANEHIRLLSLLSHTLHEPGIVDKIVATTEREKVINYFICGKEECSVSLSASTDRQLIHIFVQDESLFEDIIQAVSSVDATSIVVVDSQYEGDYLRRIPLFANVWSDKDHDFSKIILVILEKDLTNDVIRRVDHICGGLHTCDHVLLTVQSLFFSAGNLQL